MQEVYELINRVADVRSGILIMGETGTGKEMVAKAIHYHGRRSKLPFVALECPTVSQELFEDLLFGHKKGAYTGAFTDKPGLAEIAHQGTLFFDEIGELHYTHQSKLLRFIETGETTRLGDTRMNIVDARIIAATNRDLAREVREGRFREDLFYRLNVMPIFLPALRERKEDIPLLVDYFIEEYNRKKSTAFTGFNESDCHWLMEYAWPGNVRELANRLERAMVLSPHKQGELVLNEFVNPGKVLVPSR